MHGPTRQQSQGLKSSIRRIPARKRFTHMPMSVSRPNRRWIGHTGPMESESPKPVWANRLPGGPPLRDELARVVDSDDGRDEAENSYFEDANDPQFVTTETARRRFKSQLRRRLRHRESNARRRSAG